MVKISNVKLLTFFLIIFLLSSCNENIRFEDVLTSSECSAPCWMEIEPGKTTKEEALYHLRNLPELIDVDGIKTRNYMGDEQIGWDFLIPKVEGWINFKSGSVSSIEIGYITALAGKSRFLLKNAIDLYGVPTDIYYERETGDTPFTSVCLVIPEDGVAYAYAQSERETLIISPEQEVYTVWFFIPEEYPRAIESELPVNCSRSHHYQWSGYTEIRLPQQ